MWFKRSQIRIPSGILIRSHISYSLSLSLLKASRLTSFVPVATPLFIIMNKTARIYHCFGIASYSTFERNDISSSKSNSAKEPTAIINKWSGTTQKSYIASL